jgi:microcystin-dependent protein
MQYFYPYSSTDPTKSDPDGWVICDGQTRTVTDSRYAVIAPLLNTVLGVTTNTANSIRPPDLTGKFLYGSSTPTTVNTTGGATSTTLTSNNMPQHNHTVNETAHTHTATQSAHSHGGNVNLYIGGITGTTNRPMPYTANLPATPYTATTITTDSQTPAITVASATTGITVNNAGSATPTPVPILPPYVTINYIMKY